MSIKFHVRCGRSVTVKDEGLTVENTKSNMCDGYGAALTNRPLRTSELFQVEISNVPLAWLTIGVTSLSPQEVEFPQFMGFLTPAWMLWYTGCQADLWMKGRQEINDFLSRDVVKALKEGDKLGLMVTPDRELLFFINRTQVGSGTSNIPENVYAFVDLPYDYGDSVKLIPDLMGVIPDLMGEEHHLAICNRMIQQKGMLTLTIMHGMISGPPRVGKSTMLSQLFGLKPISSPAALPQPPTAATFENPSTGVAEKIPPVTVKRSTTLLGTAFGPGMTWELQTLDSEAIGLLKAIITTVEDEAGSISDSELSSTRSTAVHSSLEQPRPVSKKLAGLITAFKQWITHRPKTHQPQLSTVDSDYPEGSRVSEERGATAAIPGLKLPDQLFRDAYRSSQKDTIQSLLDGSFTIYLTDTAGQPEFQELLAALVAGPSVFFLVFKLTDSLNDQYVVEYVRPGAKKSKPYVSSFTVKQVLLQSLASIACTCSHVRQGHDEMKPIAPKVILVGTHKDIASKEQIEAIQRELKETLQGTAYDRQNIVVYASRDEPVVTVDNLHPEGKDIDKVRAMIEKISKDPAFQISVPSPILVFSLILRGLSNPVMTYQQCRSIAEECGIKTPQELNVALWFLHAKLGVIRYFPHIKELRDIVIRDPQIIFDKITDLISNTFTFETTGRYSEEEFQKTGIFPLHEIERLTTTSDELFTPVQVMKLLEYLHIIVPIQDKRGRVMQYFMPCVLTHATPVPKDTFADQLIPPVLVTFRCGYCPKGIFSALVVYLLSSNKTRGSAWQLKKDEMARGQVTFYAGEESNIVTVTTHITHLEVSVQPTRIPGQQYAQNLHIVCSTIRESIDEGIVTVCKTLRYSCDAQFTFAFNCQHTSCTGSKRHAAIQEEDKPLVLKCSRTGSVEGLSPYHRLWFGKKLDGVSLSALERTDALQSGTGASPTSEAHERVAQKRDKIINFLAANVSPGSLADKLREKHLINDEIRHKALVKGIPTPENIRPMVDAVITRIELNVANYDKFISVLKQFESLDDLIHFIQN